MRHSMRRAGLLAAGVVALAAVLSQPAAMAGTGALTTQTWTGTTSKASPAGGTFYLTTGAGTVTTTLTYSVSGKKSQMWWKMETTPGDTVVMAGPSPAPVIGSAVVPGGTYGWKVVCVCNAAYTLTVTYPSP